MKEKAKVPPTMFALRLTIVSNNKLTLTKDS